MGEAEIKKEIDAVTALWDRYPPASHLKGEPRSVQLGFYQGLRKLGWTPAPYEGFFKTVYMKGQLVLKFHVRVTEGEYRIGGIDDEWRIWRHAKPWKRGYLARCFAYYKFVLLFQEKVPKLCWRHEECKKARVVAEYLRIKDWEHNHGHKKNGRPIFFDYDNDAKRMWRLRKAPCRKSRSMLR